MSSSLTEPITFKSPKSGHTTQYVLLNPKGDTIAKGVILYCYSAGGRSVDVNRYQGFLHSHSAMSILCIDRWPSGPSCSRDGPGILHEMADLMAELLDHFNITQVGLACHSAGGYQGLSFAAHHKTRVKLVFLLCAHVTFAVTDSSFMKWLATRAPAPFLTIARKIDGGPIGKFILKHFMIDSKDDRMIMPSSQSDPETYHLDDLGTAMHQERSDLDYMMCFGKSNYFPAETALDMFYNCM